MRWTYTIGRIRGTEVKVHVTFLLLLAWFHPGIRSRRERNERARHPTGDRGEDVVDLAEHRRQRA